MWVTSILQGKYHRFAVTVNHLGIRTSFSMIMYWNLALSLNYSSEQNNEAYFLHVNHWDCEFSRTYIFSAKQILQVHCYFLNTIAFLNLLLNDRLMKLILYCLKFSLPYCTI